ncbi:carboxymuconolactone decarboxylase family protein [Caballeronia sp. J97]|uniref:carboxymuconolactone decarboxylase family protein n=1 Tax=Caballeronia sp. J97 TaxID=2805429 RepID=UPI002AB00A9A|nr:carboxymuconolactone decarboxylase family protein [Caballeronia sp. J97]
MTNETEKVGDAIDWAGLKETSRETGYLQPGFKALILAASHAVKGWPSETHVEMSRALESGVHPDTAWAAASLILSSRGFGPADLMAAALLKKGEHPPAPNPSPSTLTVDEALVQLMSDGDLPEWAAPLAKYAPKALARYLTIRNNAWNQNALSEREVHLILTAVNAADGKPPLAARHAQFAAKAGATPGEIIEAAAITIEVGGVTAWFESSVALGEVVKGLETSAG